MNQPIFANGLEGVIVAETELSRVDGQRGQLIVRGHEICTLAGHYSFAHVCRLLWTGQLADDCTDIDQLLAAGRALAFRALPDLGDALDATDGMDALRAAVAHLRADTIAPSAAGADGRRLAPEVAAAARLTGALATLVAAWWRRTQGAEPLAPAPTASHAHDFLRMLHGRAPTPADVAGLDSYLATVIDHGLNASTFAARVVTSTGADMVSAVVAAIGALSGPLHGGAPGPVLDMLDAIGEAEAADAWIAGQLAAGQRIMGMGHRVYRVRDPRAAALEHAVERRVPTDRSHGRLALARAVETAAESQLRARYPDRSLRANVEFYTAILLDDLGLDRRLFSLIFAASRAAGWTAHILEQRRRGRLIRPRARYIGPMLQPGDDATRAVSA